MESQVKKRECEECLSLFELDPASVVDRTRLNDPDWPYAIMTSGELRETCPECVGHRLQLVTPQKGINRTCLFCNRCYRFFDACHADGRAAISQI